MTMSDLPRYAVIGHPVAHSRSPRIHALFSEQTGVPLHYDRLLAPLDGFADAVQAFFAAGGRGLNVTVPFKEDAWRCAAVLSTRARRAGAVNTLWCTEGVLHGCNTDGVGLVGDVQRLGARLAGARVLLVGAGGAARGVLQPLLEAGCVQVRVVNRTVARAQELVRDWPAEMTPSPPAPLPEGEGSAITQTARLEAGGLMDAARPGGWDVVINATASSLGGAAPALPGGLYAAGALAYDMMYASLPTPFMQQALADGAALAADGLGMLVGQAAESFYLWHGVRPDVAPVLARLRVEITAPV